MMPSPKESDRLVTKDSRIPRVLAVCSSTVWGGAEKWVLRACEQLHRREHRVDLVVRDLELFRSQSRESVPLHRLPLRSDRDFASVIALARRARRGADVLLVTKRRDYWLGGLAGRLAGVPVLLRLGIVRRMRQRHFADRLRYGVFPAALLVNAERTRETLEETPWLRSKPISVIYNGVDAPGPLHPERRAQLRQQLGVGNSSILILGGGRLTPQKRWNWLIDATADLTAAGHDVMTRIFGEGDRRAALEDRVRERRISEHFRLEGFRADLTEWLGAADVVALPSVNEGVANIVLEALGRSVAVVATTTGGMDEVLEPGRHALLTTPSDYDAFLGSLERAVGDPALRARLGEAGYTLVRERFSWEQMTNQIEAVLASLSRVPS